MRDDADDDDDNDASDFKERRLEVASHEMPEPVLPEVAMDTASGSNSEMSSWHHCALGLAAQHWH